MVKPIHQERRTFLLLEGILVASACAALSIHWKLAPLSLEQFLPATIYEIETRMSLDANGEDVNIQLYLPETDERQTLIGEHVESGEFAFAEHESTSGRVGRWSAENPEGNHALRYTATLSSQALRYDLANDLIPLAPAEGILARYVKATDAIQVEHPEIRALWNDIAPPERTTTAILEAIFNYTRNELEPAEFKGVTDALTALRLKQASCNGKSRLFVALARLNNIPARLVGGVILTPGKKRTSHQWVEAWVGDRWIPFCPTNGYFAEIPKNYLTLYRNDEALFRHTSNINFDYQFDIKQRLAVSPELMGAKSGRAANPVLELFRELGLDTRTSGVFLLFPVAALLISFCRNVLGITSFGVFLPMLVAAACRFTGLVAGLVGFVLVMMVAALLHYALNRARVLQIPKLAALITVITGLIIVASVAGARNLDPGFALLIMFPVVILSFAAERLHEITESGNWREAASMLGWTVVVTVLCFLVFSSRLLNAVFLNFPELLLIVLATQIALGRWSGLRVSEFVRFRQLMKTESGAQAVLGLNERNLTYVNELNDPSLIELANDKVRAKQALERHGIPVPETLAIAREFSDIAQLEEQLGTWDGFAVKPANGRRGNGILVVVSREGADFRLASGKRISRDDLLHHCREITQGTFSMGGTRDLVLLEALIEPEAVLHTLAPAGIADIRIILHRGDATNAMLRLPTAASNGKANLHQGAIGVAVDLVSGETLAARQNGRVMTHHPESGKALAGVHLPHWARIVSIAHRCYRAIPLGYMGVDVCIDRKRGPMVLEVNARPGLEIQNVQGAGLKPMLQPARGGV